MIDVSKKKLDVKSNDAVVEMANEENEWVSRLNELASLNKKQKKAAAPKKFRRVSARQQNAIGRR